MALKIGDMLAKAGIITTSQLDAALKQQVAYGGKLGTNLIELGFVDEESLAFFLGENSVSPMFTLRSLIMFLKRQSTWYRRI